MPPICLLARAPRCQVSAARRVSPRCLNCEGHGAFFVSPIADGNAAQRDDIHDRFGRSLAGVWNVLCAVAVFISSAEGAPLF